MVEYGRILVKIRGVTPLLMNRVVFEDLDKTTVRKKLAKYDHVEEARKHAYIDVIDGKEQLYIPCEAVYRCILNAAKWHRVKKGISLSRVLAGRIRIEPEKIGLGHKDYEVDVRPVNIQKNKVLRARAMVRKWDATFYIIFDKSLIEIIGKLKDIIDEAGHTYGLLDYRPERGGPYGVFDVVEFKVVGEE